MITLISHVAEVPTVAPTLATMIGLGVGIDYALFIVTRHQEQRRAGMDDDGVDRPRRRDVGRRGRVRRHHGDRRAALAGGRRASRSSRRSATRRRSSSLVAVAASITLLPALLGDRRRRHRPAGAPAPAHAAGRPPSARLGAVGAVRRAAPAPVRARRARRARSRSRCPRSTSTSASRTTARCPRAPRRGRPTTGMTTAFGVGANGPLLVSVDMSKQPAKPDQSKLDQLNKQESDQKAQAQARRRRRSRSREPRGARACPPAPGAGAGPAAARQADQADLRQGADAAQAARPERRPTRG